MTKRHTRWRCKECDRPLLDSEILRAPNPFDSDDVICGCPYCKSVVGFYMMCDDGDCVYEATCGWPSPDGYRWTCNEHYKPQEGVT